MPDGPGRLGLPLESAAGRPKVWVAAHKPRMLRLTGQYADGWLPVDAPSPAEYRTMKTTVADHAAAAGRPEPESGLFLFVLLGESRDRIREMFEAQPMAKLLALWMSPAPDWARHGLESPAGDSRAYIDVIPHGLDPAALRELAPRIPFELVEEYLLAGNAEEVAQRIRPYADAGLQHPVIMNLTGLVGGVEEAMARGSDLAALGRLVQAMGASQTVPAAP
jgi:phthiodiolone/phenolphthiodiolone dimycocerosates ketoreductase